MAKTNKDSKSDSGKKKKKNKKTHSKKLLSGPTAMAMKSKTESPFETIWSRNKFNILGKKRKGEDKRTGLSRFRAIEKRKGTLLKEYEQSGKSSVFLDKRIGEQNESLAEFDKAILRSQRARQLKVTKKSKFNLSDGEEDDDIYGSGPFSERDDFEEELPPDDVADRDEMAMKSALSKHSNETNYLLFFMMNGNELDILSYASFFFLSQKQKSKKEVMEEIILKSKFFKAQKSKDKEENEELMEQLDKDFSSLVQSEALLSLTQPSKTNALNALVNKASSKEFTKNEITAPPRKEISKQEQPDDYDKLVKEMGLDMRARPSDRTKTPEEIAEEEKERLQQLEKERLKRMSADDESSDDDDDDDYKDLNTSSAKKLKSISGDDLGDSFSLEEETAIKKGWVDEILQRDTDNIDDEGDESSEDYESGEDQSDQEGENENSELQRTVSLKDWEQSDDDKLSTDSEEDEEGEEEEEEGEEEDRTMNRKDMRNTEDIVAVKSGVELLKTNEKLTLGQDDALPFVIEAPNNLAEFRSLLDNRSDSEVAEAIYRIRTCNPIGNVEVNRKKMQVVHLWPVILRFIFIEIVSVVEV
ncbi:Nucleolar protein [Thalictrum thalictroides]|uniref:Nucleolar protein n=1 Tax=Thalictrum thalictroides TaxID=46969 RepID=A0A7J6VJB6_THATH|nr:Nucleolar protein [Thalictrum thalictroides]